MLNSVLGVIDLRDGRAVHAIAGQRERYLPLDCDLTNDGDAVKLAIAYAEMQLGGIYVADLDAIETDSAANRQLMNSIVEIGCPVWIDAGVSKMYDTVCRSANADVKVRRVVGTESLDGFQQLEEMCRDGGETVPVLSIDLREGAVVSKGREIRNASADTIAEQTQRLGIEWAIVLELGAVGSAAGPQTVDFCRRIKRAAPTLRMASGGGIRTANDISLLEKAGCERFLIGTALHNGRKKFLIGHGSC